MSNTSSPPDPPPESASSERTDREQSRAIANALLEVGAVKLQPTDPFTWSSGLAAPIYCDNRRTIAYPSVRRRIRDGFVAMLDRASLLPTTIAGTATAGIPHAAWLSEAVNQPMAYVRASAKEHGTGARIEGHVAAGDEVVVLEDLISTGGSALSAVEALRDAGATVTAVLAIFSYQLDPAEAAFREAEVARHVLTDFATLTDVAHDQRQLSDAELQALKTWRRDPTAWSLEHGGARPE